MGKPKPENSTNAAVNGTRKGPFLRPTKNLPTASTPYTSNEPKVGGDVPKSLDTGKPKATTDRSQLNFPYDVRLSGFASLQNAVTKGTPRMKRILMEECDYFMECRVCRNFFKTVPNFVSHKTHYCKKAFDSTFGLGLSNLLPSGGNLLNIQYEVDPQVIMEDNCNSDDPTKERSVADFYNELALRAKAKAEMSFAGQPSEEKSTSSALRPVKENVVQLQIKPLVESSNGCVVLQQNFSCDPSTCDITSSFVNPFQKVVLNDTAILGPEGKVMFTGTKKGIDQVVAKLASRIRAKEEKLLQNNNPDAVLCDNCQKLFSSEKAVRQHQLESPDCCSWPFKSTATAKRIEFSSNSSVNTSSNNSERPWSQRGTETQEKNNVLQELPTDASAPCSNRLPKSLIRRLPYKEILQRPLKTQRSLHPAMKIKMKYIKLENSSAGGENSVVKAGSSSRFSCNRCSASFGKKHEISMHLALCRGVINYADLKEAGSPIARIGILARHDFMKSSGIRSSCDSNSGSLNCDNMFSGSVFETRMRHNH